MLLRLWGRFLCLLGYHDYTSNHMMGIEPDMELVIADPVAQFKAYSRMWCVRPDCDMEWS